MMPRMDGYEVTRLYREFEEKMGVEPIPIVAVSGLFPFSPCDRTDGMDSQCSSNWRARLSESRDECVCEETTHAEDVGRDTSQVSVPFRDEETRNVIVKCNLSANESSS